MKWVEGVIIVKFKLFFLFFIISIIITASTEVKIILPKSSSDVRFNYYLDLLKLSLDKTKKEYGTYKINIEYADISRQRLATYLTEGSPFVDVIWTGTNIEREKSMLPVRVPLLKGLKGLRLLVINKYDQEVFSKINNINDLKKLVAIQGVDWPDTAILLANGFKVETSTNYEGMFKMVDSQRVDYFPRALNEPFDELALRPDLDLVIEDKIMLFYFLPNFFFVNTKKPLLRDRIEKGLNIAISDGSFDKLFYNHPSNKEVLNKVNFSKMKIFKLDNPFLTEETKKLINNKKYILNIE